MAVGGECWDLRRGGGRLGFRCGEKTDPSDEFPLAACEGEPEGDRRKGDMLSSLNDGIERGCFEGGGGFLGGGGLKSSNSEGVLLFEGGGGFLGGGGRESSVSEGVLLFEGGGGFLGGGGRESSVSEVVLLFDGAFKAIWRASAPSSSPSAPTLTPSFLAFLAFL